MIPELPSWKLKELRERLVKLEQQLDAGMEEYQNTILELRRAGYYEGNWLEQDGNFNYPTHERSELFPRGPEELMYGQLTLKYIAEPSPPSAHKAWRRFCDHFGQPPVALYWHWEHRWVAEFPRPSRVSLFVDEALKQIY